MKSKFFPALFALPITAGVCAAYLRSVQIGCSAEVLPSELVSPAVYGFIAVSAVAVLMALVAAFILKGGVDFKSDRIDNAANTVLYIAAAFILVYAGFQVVPLLEKFELIRLVLALFSVYAAVSLLVLGKYNMSERSSLAYYVFSAVPVFWACFMIVVSFREESTNPVVYEYASKILSYLSILAFSYSIASYVLGRTRRGVAVFSCFIGIFFMIVELVAPLFLIGKLPILSLYRIEGLLPIVAYLIMMPLVMIKIIKK